jgi:hypothetical protein
MFTAEFLGHLHHEHGIELLTWVPTESEPAPAAGERLALDPNLEIFFAKDLLAYRALTGEPFTMVAVVDRRAQNLAKRSVEAIEEEEFVILTLKRPKFV